MQRRHLGALITAATLAALAPLGAQAQADYPNRALKLIVDGPAGGINDIWGRRFAQRIGEAMKQTVIVDNRVGASGTLSVQELLKAPPDGYTFFYGGLNPLVIYPGAGGTVRYDPQKDVVPVALGTMGYPVLVTGTGSGTKTLADAVARSAGKERTCGTGGIASLQHFACEQFAKAARLKFLSVPYKAGALAVTDAGGGQIDFAVGYHSEIQPLIAAGKVQPLAVYGPKRLPRLPEVPTMAEAGYPGIELFSFSGFFVPAGTPAPIVQKLHAELGAAMARPEMAEWLGTAGGVYEVMTQAEFAELYRRETQKWKRMSAQHNIRVEP